MCAWSAAHFSRRACSLRAASSARRSFSASASALAAASLHTRATGCDSAGPSTASRAADEAVALLRAQALLLRNCRAACPAWAAPGSFKLLLALRGFQGCPVVLRVLGPAGLASLCLHGHALRPGQKWHDKATDTADGSPG